MTSLIAIDEVEAWLKARRDSAARADGSRPREWYALDDALDDLREHMQTGAPLSEAVRGPHHEEQG